MPKTDPPDERRRGIGRRQQDKLRVVQAREGHAARLKRGATLDALLPVGIAAVLVLLVVNAVMSVAVLRHQTQLDTAQTELAASAVARDAAIVGACERLQLLRDDVNFQASAIYRLLRLTRRMIDDPNGQQLFDEVVRSTLYAPPTDCARAVQNAGSYRSPKPVPFEAVARCFGPGDIRPVPPCKR